MVKYDSAPGTLLDQFKLRNRINARRPAARSPSLHDSLTRHKFDVSSSNIPAEEREPASHFATDLAGLVSQVHGLQDPAEPYDLFEPFVIGERLINALPARFENRLLMNGFRTTRNLVLGCCRSVN
jgi:hypothetical protein